MVQNGCILRVRIVNAAITNIESIIRNRDPATSNRVMTNQRHHMITQWCNVQSSKVE